MMLRRVSRGTRFYSAVASARCSVGEITLQFETGRVAMNADGSVLASQTSNSGTTTVLATVVADSKPPFSHSGDYNPLNIDFRIPEHSLNKIPRTRNRRDMGPSDGERLSNTMISR